jgi:methylated-DNA-[protein]-cysteine S-methyltransferase
MIQYSVMSSPVGGLLLVSEGGALTGIYMEQHKRGRAVEETWSPDDGALRDARAQLEEYFAGGRKQFELRIALAGTPFQRKVWAALAAIPYGTTTTYQELARAIGTPKSARAVGAAVGRNPVSIVIPCHRVVGADGSLTGYAGGPERKRWLLEFEQARATTSAKRSA